MSLTITPAHADDLQSIHDIHKASWASAYASMVPDEALGAPLDAHMARTWSELPGGILLARLDDVPVGFIRLKTRDGWPYVDNLHVDPKLRSGGIGRALMAAGCAELQAQDAGRVWLTVVAANHGARRFYKRMGGIEAAQIREILLGVEVATYPVIWTRLDHLAKCSK
ncbi:GNAT family N-acetyltransferase [Oceaniglobus indicus]|uniref:GNAT family N-acetyltransferase n=1 Tax=Oceaniglobus indicus TaxID=2047749 RepID=UPI000C18A5CF|nr:GNAT family N-acetyltransferase [Oceaniglobus indicus]